MQALGMRGTFGNKPLHRLAVEHVNDYICVEAHEASRIIADSGLYLSFKYIQSKPIEAADDGLLNIQPKVVQSPHSGEQEARSAATEHVDVDSPPFS